MQNYKVSFVDTFKLCLRQNLLAYVIVLIALLLLYVPIFYDLFTSVWNNDTQSHGPVVFLLAIWFLYFKSKQLLTSPIQRNPSDLLGWLSIVSGTLLYVIGYSQSVYIFSILSLIFILFGLLCLTLGYEMAIKYWFALFFFVFLIPWPASIIDAITQPMKIAVSFSSEQILYRLDYPVARSGVIIQIGSYKLLVADACAGLNSLFTLEAIGLLYINVINHQAFWRNVLLAILIIPVSFTSNVFRVCTLALITYYMGDEAGQGFLHNFSGMLLFLTALILIISIDSLIQRVSVRFNIRSLLS